MHRPSPGLRAFEFIRDARDALGSVDIHAIARKAAERWMKAQKLVSVLS
jgi:hypothetical protein